MQKEQEIDLNLNFGIFYFKGQIRNNNLIEECEVGITNNFLIIAMQNEEIVRHYSNINNLTLNKRVELDNRQKVNVSYKYYIEFKINGESLPEIVMDRNKYIEMNQAIKKYKVDMDKAEKEKAQKIEQAKLFVEQAESKISLKDIAVARDLIKGLFSEKEKMILNGRLDDIQTIYDKEKFKIQLRFWKEFSEGYDSLQDIFWYCRYNSGINQKNLKCGNKNNIFIFLITKMYNKIGNSKSMIENESIFKNAEYMVELLEEIQYYLELEKADLGRKSKKAKINYFNDFIEHVKIDKLSIYNNFKNGHYFYLNFNIGFSNYQRTLGWDSEEDDFLITFGYQYVLAYLFISLLILYRNKKDFTNNNEFFQIFLNLSADGTLDNQYITERLYPLYKEFYYDTFGELMEFVDFYLLISIINEKLSIDKLILPNYKAEINRLNDKITNSIKNNNGYETDVLLNIIKEFLLTIDKDIFLKLIGFNYGDSNIKRAYMCLFHYLFKYMANNVPIEIIDKLTNDEYCNIVGLLCDSYNRDKLNQERKRLLSGNMNKEKKYIEDKYSFENINTGYDFEIYLKGLFEGLGYYVETTPLSQDQGGDLLIKKGDETTVVQAKYYSSPVGNKAVQEVVAAIAYYNASNGMVVTNNVFTNSAIELAEVNDIKLIDGNKLNNIRKVLIKDNKI